MIEIRRAEERHINDIGNLWLEFMRFSQDIDTIYAPREGTVPVFINDYLRPVINDENSLVLVALDGGRAVGYSYSLISEPSDLVKRGRYGLIHDMFITAGSRRKGIGDKMFDEIIKWFHSNGIDRVELEVIVNNPAAYSFWEKHGFTEFKHTLFRHTRPQ